MSAWSGVLALSGFRYHAAEKSAVIIPRINTGVEKFSCFWSTAAAWGTFTHAVDGRRRRVTLAVAEGALPLRRIMLAPGPPVTVTLQGRPLNLSRDEPVFTLAEEITIHPGEELVLLG
jgi:hypothetical protein